MKRFLMLVLMLCVGLCAGCAQNQQPDPQKPENGKLTAEELEEFQAMFTPGSWYSQATTSSYTSPKDIDLHHLFYDGIGFYGLLYGHTYLTDRERRVFNLVCRRGWAIEDAAAELYLSRSSVNACLRSIRDKAGISRPNKKHP